MERPIASQAVTRIRSLKETPTPMSSPATPADAGPPPPRRAAFGSVGVVSLCAFLQLAVQFAYQVVLAKYFGAGRAMDAYVAALALPTTLMSILVGSLGYAFVPVFIERLTEAGDTAAWRTATSAGLAVGAATLALSAFVSATSLPLTRLLYPGFQGEQALLTSQVLRILAWLVLTNGLTSFLQAVHHAVRSFALPAVAPVVGTSVTLTLALLWQARGMTAIAQAVVIGSILNVAMLAPLWLRNLRRPLFNDPALKRCGQLLGPLIAGAAYYKLDPLVDRYLASELPPGNISHLGYAWRLITALLMVGTSGLAVVAFPEFARHAAAGCFEALARDIARAFRFLVIVLVPILVALGLFCQPLVRDLFQRGEFTSSDTRAVSLLILCYSAVLVGGGAGELLAKVFYGMGNTRTPTIIGVVGFTLGVALKLLLTPRFGAVGLACATSIYYLFNAGWMAFLIRRLLGARIGQGIIGSVGRSLAASAGAAIVGYLILQIDFDGNALTAAVVGLPMYGLLLRMQGDEFTHRWTQAGLE